MVQDLRFAFRILLKDRWFTLVAVLALGLGIGVNATVFTFVNAVLLRGLPYEDSNRIIFAGFRNLKNNNTPSVSWHDFQDWRTQAKSFSGLGAVRPTNMNLSEPGKTPERTAGAFISTNTWSLLGQPLLLGRDFTPADEQPNAEPVAILGHTVWQNRYGADPSIIGRVVKVNEGAVTIVGVMPPGVRFPNNADMWMPVVAEPEAQRINRSLGIFGRLAPGISVRQAETELRGITARIAEEHAGKYTDLEAYVMPYNDRFNGGPIRVVFLALMGAVGFVLLIACANVANLMLSRSSRRAREVAVRFAMGASRMRVIRQLLIESTLLACAGGVLGIGLAWIGIRLFDASVQDVGKPYWIVFTIDPTVIAFLAGVCLLTGILFGIVPALQVSRTNVNEILKEGGRGSSGGRRARRLTSTMVVAELALTIVLLAGAGLMVRSFLNLYSLNLGFETSNLLTTRMQLAERKYKTPEQRRVFFDQLLPRVQAIPGVQGTALTSALPLNGGNQRGVEVEGKPIEAGQEAPRIMNVIVSPGYFDALGVQLRRGRAFTNTDGNEGYEVAVVNERFASRFFPNEDPIGRRIRWSGAQPQAKWLTIVGISPAVQQGSPQNADPDTIVYTPTRMDPFTAQNVIVRTTGSPTAIATQLREAVQAVDPDQPVFNVLTMDQFLDQGMWPYRVFGSMFAIFAFIALILSAVGIYAVTAYSVTQRTAEIGVRMALGARSQQVSWLILRQGVVQLAIGLVIGLALAFGVSRVLQPLLVKVPASDPITFIAIALILGTVTLAACLIPARRATKLDPLVALRVE